MVAGDIQAITQAELAQGWQVEAVKQEARFRDQQEWRSYALIAELEGEVAGYINLYHKGLDGPDQFRALPEIVDFGVFIKLRNRGIGSKLMDVAETLAADFADTTYLGMGVHYGYGSAQRMYVKHGYVPDGSGVWYGARVCEQYEDCCNDDDLALYLSKKLH